MPRLDDLRFCGDIAVVRWKLTESWQELLESCAGIGVKVDADKLPKAEGRRCEMLAELLMLAGHFGRPTALEHDRHGAPRVTQFGGYVSISHTRGLVMMAFSDNEPVGIDVERISERVMRVRGRFVGDTEAQHIVADDVAANTLVWTAKEAMYKLAGVPGASLRDDFSIDSAMRAGADGRLHAEAHCMAGGGRQAIELCSMLDAEEQVAFTMALFAVNR